MKRESLIIPSEERIIMEVRNNNKKTSKDFVTCFVNREIGNEHGFM